jgi:hypothetical protein
MLRGRGAAPRARGRFGRIVQPQVGEIEAEPPKDDIEKGRRDDFRGTSRPEGGKGQRGDEIVQGPPQAFNLLRFASDRPRHAQGLAPFCGTSASPPMRTAGCVPHDVHDGRAAEPAEIVDAEHRIFDRLRIRARLGLEQATHAGSLFQSPLHVRDEADASGRAANAFHESNRCIGQARNVPTKRPMKNSRDTLRRPRRAIHFGGRLRCRVARASGPGSAA